MLDKVLTIVSDLLQPQKNWGCFSRKMISPITLSLLAFLAFDVYWNFRTTTDKYRPVAELMVSKKNRAEEVRRTMEQLHQRHPAIKGIWLYSWPDAVNLDLVHKVGQGDDPIPTGTFHTEDAGDVGRLGMDICTQLNKLEDNTACTIFGEGDAWGIIVVIWDDTKEKPKNPYPLVDGLANRITHLLYYAD